MPRTIQAVYEHGVFTPLDKVDLKESAQVAIRIVALDDWQEHFNRLLRKVRGRSSAIPSDEIEKDIREAVSESRAGRHDR